MGLFALALRFPRQLHGRYGVSIRSHFETITRCCFAVERRLRDLQVCVYTLLPWRSSRLHSTDQMNEGHAVSSVTSKSLSVGDASKQVGYVAVTRTTTKADRQLSYSLLSRSASQQTARQRG